MSTDFRPLPRLTVLTMLLQKCFARISNSVRSYVHSSLAVFVLAVLRTCVHEQANMCLILPWWSLGCVFLSLLVHFAGRLPRGLRACSVLMFFTTAFQFFRAETLGGLRDVATRTHAREEHVSPLSHHCITLHMSLNIRLDTPFP